MSFGYPLCIMCIAAGEVCPICPAHPVTAHWGYAYLSKLGDSEEVKLAKVSLKLSGYFCLIQLLAQLVCECFDAIAMVRL